LGRRRSTHPVAVPHSTIQRRERLSVMNRDQRWASTMRGFVASDLRLAHVDPAGTVPLVGPPGTTDASGAPRGAREEHEATTLAPRSTRSSGAAAGVCPEEADAWRACFERDRDRIVASVERRPMSSRDFDKPTANVKRGFCAGTRSTPLPGRASVT
ncbi:MAG: hypothetical protein ACRDV4_05430, partial [Acidimicrobiales bacterium]